MRHALVVGVLLAVYAVVALVGLGWGLPTARIDPLLFGDDPVWSGEKIAELSNASARFSDSRGADVDADPVVFAGPGPVELTATEADVAAIYRRYRLYTHQPDEMITLMALAGMRPREGHFDPKLYQYGGLFIYPVGACIAAGELLGAIQVTSDLTYYLDHPDEFGKFYVAARLYVVAWGALGVLLVYAIGHRLGGSFAAAMAAVLFTLMPVVVCMAHEAKPHLPGAVLMLAAVWWAMRYADHGRRRDWAGMCLASGAAFGMVLSALPIFVVIPLVEWRRGRASARSGFACFQTRTFWRRAGGGLVFALLVYVTTNPYVAINAFANRAVLGSNLSNSTAMYAIGRAGEGLVRVVELTVEGATLPVVVLGVIGLALAIRHGPGPALPLLVPAGLIFVQFVLLGAGKPAEYGRFGVFCNTVLAISTACVLAGTGTGTRSLPVRGIVAAALVVLTTGYLGGGYLYNFHRDTAPDNTREQFAPVLARFATRDARDGRPVVCVLADPAPYGLPPMNFARIKLLRYRSWEAYRADPRGVLVVPADANPPRDREGIPPPGGGTGQLPYSPISWANKPMVLHSPLDRNND
jgi:hypothetical protein